MSEESYNKQRYTVNTETRIEGKVIFLWSC